jgi:carnitine monooxygenase subunit
MPRDDTQPYQPRLKGFSPDPARSYNLAGAYYTDPLIHEREKEAIFYRNWIYVGHASQLTSPGDYLTVRIMDENILVIRGKDNEIRAFYNVCRHRAHELLEGAGNAKVITCPYHAWSYHADGQLRTARGTEKVAGFDKKDFCLRGVRLENFLNMLFVNLDPEAASLKSQTGALEAEIRSLAPDIDKLVLSRRLPYTLKADWKNVVDNYLECYHCTVAHPAFADLVDIKQYRSKTHGIYSTHYSPLKHGDNKAYRIDVEKGGAKFFVGWYLWPNVTISTFPGCPNMTVMLMLPAGPGTTQEYFDFLFEHPEPNAEGEAAIRYIDEVLQPEDIGLVESVQRGLKSRGYGQGRYVVDAERSDISEHALHHFHNLVLTALGD